MCEYIFDFDLKSINICLDREYKDNSIFLTFSEEQKKDYIINQIRLLEQILANLDCYFKNSNELIESYYYSQICLAYEYLINICFISRYWDIYFKDIKRKQFGYVRDLLLKNIAKSPESTRLSNILEYVRIQRNNFLHFPLLKHDYSNIMYELHFGFNFLNKLFNLNLKQELLDKIKTCPNIVAEIMVN